MPLFSAICAQCTSSTGSNRMSRRSDGSPKYHPVWQSQLKRWIDHGYMDIRYPYASSATRNAPCLCMVNLGILAVTVFRLCFRSWSSVARRNALASPSEQRIILEKGREGQHSKDREIRTTARWVSFAFRRTERLSSWTANTQGTR